MRGSLTLLVALVALSAPVLAGCGSDDPVASGSSSATEASTDPTSELEGDITVSAATSLTDAFTEIADDFSAAHPEVEVTFTFDSSSTLSAQILEGAPADVYASADEATMATLVDEGLIAGEPEVVARNQLAIVTKPGNPAGIETLADLADAGVISLGGEDVPCGRYAEQALRDAGVTIDESNVTRGQNVGATLTAVSDGDAAAGIVYVTDAEGAGEAVEAVAIPADENVIATYPIGVLRGAGDAEVAEAFVAHVMGAEGQAVLRGFGFLAPA